MIEIVNEDVKTVTIALSYIFRKVENKWNLFSRDVKHI